MRFSRSLTVTAPAADTGLLALGELRAAAGVAADDATDVKLVKLGLKVAADIASHCNVAAGNGADQPTLRRETLTETFRHVGTDVLVLSRRHRVSVISVTEDDDVLTSLDYEVNQEGGMLTRLFDDRPGFWRARKLVVVYQAGFETVPHELAHAASDFVKAVYQDASRDPLAKSYEREIPGVLTERTDFWVGSVPGQKNEGPVPDVVAGQLKRFRNAAIG